MTKEILINVEPKEIRVAWLAFGKLDDLSIERKSSKKEKTGNIYRGKVINILHNIQSAFIDIAEEENGFIHISDILENTRKFEEMFDMDFDLENAPSPSAPQPKDIAKILKIDQPVIVQVVKEAVGTKGARLTSNLSIPGRYLVLLPNSPHRGVSRKIENASVREKLKRFIRSFEMPKEMGLICRTASTHATAEILIEEAQDLLKTWEQIVEKFHTSKNPKLLFEESDIVKRAVISAVDKKVDRLIVDDFTIFKQCQDLYKKYEKEHALTIEHYRDKTPLYEKYDIERQIDKALKRKVWLHSGGYLYFDKTEAMCTIDVNSGKSETGAYATVEEALVQINLEAAEEIARQLRLRNIGGLIICDFIDMRFKKNQRRVLQKLKESMKQDSAKYSILGMSEFGLIEMTRQRSRFSLQQILFTSCPYCTGYGTIKSYETTVIEIERMLKKICQKMSNTKVKLVLHPQVYDYIKKSTLPEWEKVTKKSRVSLDTKSDDTYHLNQYQFYSLPNEELITI